MKIVHIFHHYWPVVGGLENAMKALAEEQARLGHEVHVITSTYGAEGRPREEEIGGVHVHRTSAAKLGYPDLMLPLERLVILKHAEIVHAWSQTSLFTYVIARNAKRLNKTLVYYFLGVDYLKNHHNLLIRILGSKYQMYLTKEIAKYTDAALVVNEYEGKLLRAQYGLEPHVVPHGIDDMYLNTPNRAEEFRRKFRIEGTIIGYVGRIHSTKGLDLLIRAFPRVVKERPDAMLVIAGKGDEKYFAHCLKLAEKLGMRKRIAYLGFISEEDKIGLIDASELIVVPSRHAGESFPLLVAEVKARGKPIVATNRGALPYLIRDGEEGLITDADPRSLGEAITRVLRESDRFHVKSKPLTWREVAYEIIKIYKEI